MTLKELSQLFYIKKEIAYYEEKILQLKNSAEKTTQNISSLPGANQVNDKVGENATNIVQYNAQIEIDKNLMEIECKKLESYIKNIDDSLTRQIFELRFIKGYQWQKIAISIGGGNTKDSVKKIVYRYIKKK